LLRIDVQDGHIAAARRQGDGQMRAQGGLPGTTLLLGYTEYFRGHCDFLAPRQLAYLAPMRNRTQVSQPLALKLGAFCRIVT
jgi:hypothetical protein